MLNKRRWTSWIANNDRTGSVAGRRGPDASNAIIPLALALLVSLISSLPALANDRDVQNRLQQTYAAAGWREVQIDVASGVVTLTGEVPHVWAKQQIEREASRVDGVDRVVNNVSISRVADDTRLQKTLDSEVRQWVLATVFDDVSVRVLGGNAVLTGYLTTPYKLSPLIDVIARTPGVLGVMSEVEILSDSAADDHLRMAVAGALYRDPAFGDAAVQRVKPIRIIVRNARVALSGSVRSNQQRTIAEDIVRTVAGVMAVDNRLLVTRTSTN
jgi:osmotically-inducible protein OsmY